ncbi:MAG: hypothetical protein HXY40_10620 [Chloroflexi bacterium]|nr:hypothetical protein [Chloroflexota bacterium]
MNTLRTGRIIFGVMYFIAAIVHLLFGVFNPASYSGWAENALLPFYVSFFRDVVPFYAFAFALFLAVFEVVLALLILYKGFWVKLGFFLSIVFQILLAPLGWWGFFNIVLAVVQVIWMRESYPATAFVTEEEKVYAQ